MAVSDISLSPGMRSNLRALQSTAILMDRTQERLSTGKRVNSPIDDPVNFFTAAAHMQRASDLSLRKDGMTEAIQTIESADAGYTAITALLSQAKGLAQQAATSDAATRANLAAQYDLIMGGAAPPGQLDLVAQDSGYKGINLLDAAYTLTVEFAPTAGGSTLVMAGQDADSASLGANAAATGGWIAATYQADIAADVLALDAALEEVRARSAALGSNMAIIQTRLDFTTTMIDTLVVGADNLTLADMNEESANMLMLETRQQLGVAALGMSTDYAQSILRLFS